MRILALGDIVGKTTIDYLQKNLWDYRKKEKIDFVIANGENTSEIRGLCAKDAHALLDTGIDIITLGNHSFGMKDIYAVLEDESRIIRPANYPPTAPGAGYVITEVDGFKILCINIAGRVYLEPLNNPFDTVDRILEREVGNYDLAIMDIHAEATSEKLALAYYFDGRIHMMFGTHTHIPTADEQILPKGSGYITDLGMCGPKNGILGTNCQDVIDRLRFMLPTQFHVAEGEIEAMGAIFEIDPFSGKLSEVRRVRF